jgi:hypothetical protein
VTIPDSITNLGDAAFQDCTGLTSITIPDSLNTIGAYAFTLCSSLTSITIPGTVTTIEIYAFDNCKNLTSVTFISRNCTIQTAYAQYDLFYGSPVTVYAPAGGTVQAYCTTWGIPFN